VAGEVRDRVNSPVPIVRETDVPRLAVAFGYFENLFALRDPLCVQRETDRIRSLNRQLLDQDGPQAHLYEMFVDATEGALTSVLEAIQNGVPDESFLVDAFNSEYGSSAIIAHFRVSHSP
jgi:ubiquitin thioesterase protein OTUB1